MSSKKLIILGGVAAGTKAASKAKRDNPALDVKVFTRDEYISYAGCGLPYFVGGIIKEKQELLVRDAETFRIEQDIRIYTKHQVEQIDPEAKTVKVYDIANDRYTEYPYDKLIIATGASPLVPPLENIELDNIYTMRGVADTLKMRELIDKNAFRTAVIVGGGFIGIEAAENLAARGIKVTIIEMAPHILPTFDNEIALIAQNHLQEKGVQVYTATKVLGFTGAAGKVAGVKINDTEIAADLVILSVGVKPNTAVAEKAGIKKGITGAIKVNEYMETNIKDIYAAGDCAENINLITGKAVWYPMGSTANKTGRIAGYNAALTDNSEPKESLHGVLGTTVVKIFDINAAKTGLSEGDAIKEGYDIETSLVPSNDKAHYYPGSKIIITKLIVEKKSGKLLGAQIIGEGVVDKPIDVIVTAITLGAKAVDLEKLDLAYAPPFSTAISSTALTAGVVQNKRKGRLKTISSNDLQEAIKNNTAVILDVREEIEFFISSIPESTNIPLNEIDQRFAEIDKTKDIVIVCKLGKRAYNAYLKLKHLGFENIKILDGGIIAYPYKLV